MVKVSWFISVSNFGGNLVVGQVMEVSIAPCCLKCDQYEILTMRVLTQVGTDR